MSVIHCLISPTSNQQSSQRLEDVFKTSAAGYEEIS